MMLSYAGAEDRAAKIGGNQQLYCSGIAVRRGGFHHRADRSIVILAIHTLCWPLPAGALTR